MTDFNMRSRDSSFESCDRSTIDKDYCPFTDNDLSDTDFEEDVADPSLRDGIVENPEDISENKTSTLEGLCPMDPTNLKKDSDMI